MISRFVPHLPFRPKYRRDCWRKIIECKLKKYPPAIHPARINNTALKVPRIRSEPATFLKSTGNNSLNDDLKTALRSNINQSQIKIKRASEFIHSLLNNFNLS